MPAESNSVDQSREMDEKNWWDLWNKSYRSEDNRDEISTELFGHVVDLMEKVTLGRPGRVLEVACGTGTFSRLLKFSAYHGLDISPAAIDVACEKADHIPLPQNVTKPVYEAADFHDWTPPTKEPFDTIICVDAIYCFRDQALVMRKMGELLSENGVIIVTALNSFVYNRIRRAKGVSLQSGPVTRWITGSELKHLVKQAGLVQEQFFSIMPRGNKGILRLINARKLNQLFGRKGAVVLRRLKEHAGLGQYNVIVARRAKI